ncbi:MAG: flagellar basal body rod C-terminal domain-containing protein, partial [Pseudomonadota bacterium]
VITRLRDGFDAVAPGEPGQDQRLRDLQDALTSLTGVAGFTGERSFAAFAAELSSDAQVRALQASERATTEAGRRDLLADAETNAMAVDSDAELARLLVVEQVFAANARVVSVVDELLERLIAL